MLLLMMMLSVCVGDVMWLLFVMMLVMEMVTMVIAMVTNDADLTSQLDLQCLSNYYNYKKINKI